MALAPYLFVHPVGRLRADMLPGESLDDALGAWIDEAEAKAADDGVDEGQQEVAATAWVYHRGFLAVYDRLSSLPEDARVDEKGQVRWSRAQVDGFLARAEEYRAAYEALTPAEEPAPYTPASVVVTATPRWF